MRKPRKKILQFLFGATEGYNLRRNVRATLLAVALGAVVAAALGFLFYFVYAHQDFHTGPF
jgi:ABC-type nitrate/sulfonate/bicarbonate transport system permease component